MIGGRSRFRKVLVAAQIAASVVVLVASGIAIRSLVAAEYTKLGFNPSRLLKLHMDASEAGYDEAQGTELYQRLLPRIRAVPGVQSAALAYTYLRTEASLTRCRQRIVVSYDVGRRTHEIGISIALGARPRHIQGIIFRQGLAMLVAGLFFGNLCALSLAAVTEHVLGGFGAPDPLTYLAVAILISTATLLACYIPARRAMKVDPMVALKYE